MIGPELTSFRPQYDQYPSRIMDLYKGVKNTWQPFSIPPLLEEAFLNETVKLFFQIICHTFQ